MLIRISPKDGNDFSGQIGEYNVISKKLRVWFSTAYMANESKTITIKDFDIPKDVKKIEVADESGYEVLAVPVSEFKAAHVDGKGFIFNYSDWKKRFLKPF